MSKPTAWRWQERHLDEGVAGLKRDKTRSSHVPPLPMETRLKVIAKTVQETPPNATHWSRALMADAMGISSSSVGRIRAESGLKPHLAKGFKVWNDPLFEDNQRARSSRPLIYATQLCNWFRQTQSRQNCLSLHGAMAQNVPDGSRVQ